MLSTTVMSAVSLSHVCKYVHSDHHYTSNERFWVLITSLFVAFGCSAIGTNLAEGLFCSKHEPVSPTECGLFLYLLFPAISCFVQLLYDNLAEFVVTCGCVQKWTDCFKSCFEFMGKAAFCILALIALIFASTGVILLAGSDSVIEKGDESDKDKNTIVMNVVEAISVFIITKLLTFMFFTSLVVWVFYHRARAGQVRRNSCNATLAMVLSP
jgi:hypothetical protein